MDVFIKYDIKKYNFVKLVEELYHTSLETLHTTLDTEYVIPDGIDGLGQDTNSILHKIFYDKLHSGWDELTQLYTKFIENVVSIYLETSYKNGDGTIFLYQSHPTFRIHYVGNRAITTWHEDGDENHKHPKGELNFWLPLTKVYGENTLWVESKPGLKDYHPVETEPGYMLVFDGNRCSHGNKVNTTQHTRVSFDFRILPIQYYDPTYPHKTATKGWRYIIGEYYTLFDKNGIFNNGGIPNTLFTDSLLLDRMMRENKCNDPWEVVDLFERTVAKKAGSRYGISVDNCTNALFLCMKYLQITKNRHLPTNNTITIPKNTYCSVPCTILNAGYHVLFEDTEWEGCYQLKPLPIYDGAVRFRENMFSEAFHTSNVNDDIYYCISFHHRKPIPIGKGGMILTDNGVAYQWFKKTRYEGRDITKMYKDDPLDMLGWNMYMTPEQAAKGLMLLNKMGTYRMDVGSSKTYRDLSTNSIYTRKN
tara:strand:- start:1900 stop:3330 length:1431 start_codon:yes stop_codon:yes gene_type:complete